MDMRTDKEAVRADLPEVTAPGSEETGSLLDTPVDIGPLAVNEDKGQDFPRPLSEMWTEVAVDFSSLLKAEAKLARREVKQNIAGYARAGAFMVVGAGMLLVAVIFLIVAAVVALAKFIGWIPALLLVAAIVAAVGIIGILYGSRRLKVLSPLPEQSLHRIAADVDRITRRADEAKAEQVPDAENPEAETGKVGPL